MLQYYLALFGVFLLSVDTFSQQCTVNQVIAIPDNGNSYAIKIEANTLASGNRILCGVRLSFEHEFVDELEFVLVSPSGKQLTLIADKSASSKTGGSSWNVLFIRSENTAHPDEFKKPVWRENKWGENQQYLGSYYPDGDAGLALFDGDRLKGTWNLIYSDKVKGGKGVLKSFGLIFCQLPQYCNPCHLDRNYLREYDFGSFCGGDPALKTIQPTLISSNLTPGFDHTFLVLNHKDRVVYQGLNPDLIGLKAGNYNIISVQYRPEDFLLLNNIKTRDDLIDLFYGVQSKVCGAFSNKTNRLTILSNPDVRDITREVFGRQQITIDGRVITSDETIVQSLTDQNGCDSLIRIHVDFKDYYPVFTQDHLFDCDHNSIKISVTTKQKFEIHRWFTRDGKISNQSDIKSNQITVNTPGTYYVVFKIEDYLDTVGYNLETDPKTPVITLSNEYKLCSANPLTLKIGYNFDNAEVKPASTASVDGDNLIIREPDLYTITVSNQYCTISKHILVQPPESAESVNIDNAAISCPDNPVVITPSLNGHFEKFAWYLDGEVISSTQSLTTDKPGLYHFRAYNNDECGVTGTAWIENHISQVDLHIEGPSLINCSNENEDNRLIASFKGEFEAEWTLPDGSMITQNEVTVNQVGEYQVAITDDSGCTYTASRKITSSTESIDFEVPEEVTIPCNSASATITALIDASQDEYEIAWSGADMGSPKNTAMVFNPGMVAVTVTHKVSRCSVTKSIRVLNEPGKPELMINSTLSRDITCNNPVRTIPIEIKNCPTCMPELTTEKDIKYDGENLVAREPGIVTITLDNGSCISSQKITFSDNTKAQKLNIDRDDIGCSGKSGRIEIKNSKDYTRIEFQSGQDTFPYTTPLRNIVSPVSYKIFFTDIENGCPGEAKIDVKAISQPPDIEYEAIHYLDCITGKALLSISGKDISRVVWYDPANNEIVHDGLELEVSEPGKYKITALNEGYCYREGIIEVKDDRSLPFIDLDPEYSLPCNDASGGIVLSYDTTTIDSVLWYGPGGWSSTEFYPTLEMGEYYVSIVGKNGCKTTDHTNVVRQQPGAAPALIAPPITCQTPYSPVHLTDYTNVDEIQWIDESGQVSLDDTFRVYNPGLISLTIQMENGCLFSNSLTVEEDLATIPFKINSPVINCDNLHPQFQVEITEAVTRPVEYQWYFGNTPVSEEATYDIEYPGDYRVEVSFDNGCIDSLSHFVKLDTTAVEFRLRTDTISCIRSKIQLRKEIATDHISKASWTGPSGFTSTAIRPNFQIPGNYHVNYVGENGCPGESEMKIYGDLDPPDVDSVDFLSLGCNGKEVDLTYFTNDSVTIQYWQLPDGQVLEDSVVQIRAKGDYTLYLEGTNGCSKIDTFTIDQTVTPKFDLMIQDAGCDVHTGTALLLPKRDTFEAIWYDPVTMNEIGRGHLSPDIASGSYLITVRNPLNNCDTTATFEIRDISNLLEAEIVIDDSLRCERSEANLISTIYPPSEHYTYEWRYGNQTTPISHDSIVEGISRVGMYSLTAIDTVNQCIAKASYNNKRAPSRLRYFDLFLTEPACDLNRPGFATMDSLIGASDMSLVTYSLNQGPYLDRDTFPFLYANESYRISTKDQYGCTLDTILMPELRGVMDRLSPIPDTTINSGDSLNFNDPAFKISYTSPDAPMSEQYTWIINPDTLHCDYDCTEMIQQQFFQTRTVSAILTNQYGCTISDTFKVYVREGDILNVPNALIPASSNSENSHVCIYTNEYIKAIELFVVFNRRGKVIFKKTNFNPRDPNQDFSNCWNGRDSQQNIYPPGNYNYYVRYKTVYGETKQKFGNILLLR